MPRRQATIAFRERAWIHAPSIAAIIALAACGWQGLGSSGVGDWAVEARPSVDALLAGHFATFFQFAPAYGGSLLLRAPFMAISRLYGGGEVAVYRLGALPCLAAMGALLLWLDAEMKRRGHGVVARLAAAVIGGFNPLAILALQGGHPEELLGGVLCVAAVLCAQRDRAALSGILVGLAIANKEWGVLAAGPVLVALPHGRWRAAAFMVTTGGLLFAPFVLVHSGGFVDQTAAVAVHAGGVFSPFQLWWSFGTPIGSGSRMGPAWLEGLGHTLPIALAVPLTCAYALRTRHTPGRRCRDAVLLLALLLLLRCALDPWDAVYYPVPFLLALLVWDASSVDRSPFIAALGSLVGWSICDGGPAAFGADQNVLATAFALAVVPAIGAMSVRLLGRSASQASVGLEPGRSRLFVPRRS